MTALLQQAFAAAEKLPAAEQDVLASRLLAELDAEDQFDQVIAGSSEKLAGLAAEALSEYRAGLTRVLVPDQL